MITHVSSVPLSESLDSSLVAVFRVAARTNTGTWLPVGMYRHLDDAREFAARLAKRGWDVEILTEDGGSVGLIES